MERTARVIFTNPPRHGIVAGAVTGLIPERPEDDRGMIFIALHHPYPTFQEGGSKAAVASDLLIIVVRFHVCFVDHVETEFVTKVEPVGIIWIVRSSDRIKVEAFHRHGIQPHGLAVQSFALRIVMIVPVDALDQHPLAIDQQ